MTRAAISGILFFFCLSLGSLLSTDAAYAQQQKPAPQKKAQKKAEGEDVAKPTIDEHAAQKPSALIGQPMPNLSGPAALSRGLLNLQKYTREVIFEKTPDGKLVMDKGRPKSHVDSYALVMNFFATYCAPCIREIPTFNKIAASYPDQPVRFLFVNVDVEKSSEEVKAFALEKGISVEMLFPSVSQTIKSYQIETLPRIIVVDRDGTIQRVITGFQENLTAQLDKEIKAMIAKPPKS
jgi:thiol-disulfide isomerase/thioredoxin